MTSRKSPDPTDRMGIYTRLEDVPEAERFARFSERYDGRDVWAMFVRTYATEYEFDSEHYHATLRKTEQTWKEHMADRQRHHALASPDDVEAWCRQLAQTRTLGTVYGEYWIRLEEFYSWLQWHTEHPHRYQPVLMAAASYETAGRIWAEKVDDWDWHPEA